MFGLLLVHLDLTGRKVETSSTHVAATGHPFREDKYLFSTPGTNLAAPRRS